MVRVVVDTNVLISSLVGHGSPRALVTELLDKHIVLSSAQLIAEFLDVLSREKFSAIGRSQVNEFLSILTENLVILKIKSVPKIVTEDPDDDIILAIASQGGADYIVSGDTHLLRLESYEGIPIIPVRRMLDELREE